MHMPWPLGPHRSPYAAFDPLPLSPRATAPSEAPSLVVVRSLTPGSGGLLIVAECRPSLLRRWLPSLHRYQQRPPLTDSPSLIRCTSHQQYAPGLIFAFQFTQLAPSTAPTNQFVAQVSSSIHHSFTSFPYQISKSLQHRQCPSPTVSTVSFASTYRPPLLQNRSRSQRESRSSVVANTFAWSASMRQWRGIVPLP
jgi:hypothetical protein